MIRNRSAVYDGDDVLRFSDWRKALQFYGAEFAKILDRYEIQPPDAVATDPEAGSPAMLANAQIHEGKPVESSPVPEFDSLARSLEMIRKTRLTDSQRRENRARL